MIDYDGIAYWCSEVSDQDHKDLIIFLRDAMVDGQITKCDIIFHWEICSSCEGNGSHSKHLGALTYQDMYDMDDEEIHKIGTGYYDKDCTRCDGTGKTREIDVERMPEDVALYIEEYFRNSYDMMMDRRAEMMMGA